MITHEKVKEIFEYKDGHLYWKIRHGAHGQIGKRVGYLNSKGYFQTKVNNKTYLIHRLIYLWHYKNLPKILDHIDCNKANNLISNLREATVSQNLFNVVLWKSNKSGYKNVQWNKKSNKWRVRLIVKGKDHDFGYYDDVELAGLVAEEARNLMHKEFARHF